jgi:arabinogalactan endo-1,4-beta-galactosidase
MKSSVNKTVKLSLLTALIFTGIFSILQTSECNAQAIDFVKGADGSLVLQVEDAGGKFYVDGVETDVLQVFRDNGFNTIRLKIWHTPEDEYNSLPNVVKMAKRAKEMGFRFMLDFHYSDTWADPGSQYKPSAWEGLSFELLTDSIFAYTRDVIAELKGQGVLPDMVQIGNEITCGMLWNDGRVCNPYDTPQQWNRLGTLIKSAVNGLKESLDAGDEVKVILHFDNGASISGCRWWFDNITEEGVAFDLIGLSYYPWWHGSMTALRNNLNDLASRYGKDIIVVEGGYPWTLAWNDNMHNFVGLPDQLHEGYPATVEGQANFLRDLMNIIHTTIDERGKGFVYWSPEYITAPMQESPWENIALFDFDGEVLPSITVFDEQPGIEENITQRPFSLHQPYPNPFRNETTLRFTIHSQTNVNIAIYDQTGRLVANLLEAELPPGTHSVKWHPGSRPAGIYPLQFISKGFVQIRKLVVQ